MTKMEMINRMIVLGIIKENKRNTWTEKSVTEVMNIYIRIVPRRLEHMKR